MLGVLGGGQLGRMFVHAAQCLGYRTAVLDPDPQSPAGLVSHHHVQGDYLDSKALAELARVAQAVTTEFENVPAEALASLAVGLPVSPSASAVAICQDRLAEKAQLLRAGAGCAPHAAVVDEADLHSLPASLFPGILKTARLGYDGKGQRQVADQTALALAWAQLGKAPCVLEKKLDLRLELSVIVGRAADGQTVNLPVQQNLHIDGILAVTQVPAPDVPVSLAEVAVERAREIVVSMGYIGVLCVEFFVVASPQGSLELVANEMAPRPHNSGHYSLDACDVSQFELQVRVLAGLPLVQPRLHSPCVMLNLLGDLWFLAGPEPREPAWAEVLALPGVHLHLYGKTAARAGRKMGHLTITAGDARAARTQALKAAALLGLPAF
jgi:5-(carboxyamino)imidazole ribonucleotide synthase